MNYNHLFNRKSLKPIRSILRNKSTSAETALWNLLKLKKLDGRKFRRQHSIGKYIVDFYCPSEKLIVELETTPAGIGICNILIISGPATPPSKGGEISGI